MALSVEPEPLLGAVVDRGLIELGYHQVLANEVGDAAERGVPQLSATVAWQSTAAIAVGAVVGIPLGIALGRALWDLFAGQISVVPQPTVPALTVVLIVAGALVTANVVALLPGWVAGRTPAAALLRAELRHYRRAAHSPVRRAIGLRTVRSGRPRRTRR